MKDIWPAKRAPSRPYGFVWAHGRQVGDQQRAGRQAKREVVTNVRTSGQAYPEYAETSGRQVEDKSKIIRPSRANIISAGRQAKRQVQTSVTTSGQVYSRQVEDKCNKKEASRETSVKSSRQEHLSREAERHVEARDNNIRPSLSRVGRHKWEASGDKRNKKGDKWRQV